MIAHSQPFGLVLAFALIAALWIPAAGPSAPRHAAKPQFVHAAAPSLVLM